LFGYLQSFSPRREVASFVGKRAFVLHDHKRYREAVELFGLAFEMTPRLATYASCVVTTVAEWKKHLQSQYPPRFPRRIDVLLRPDLRRWPTMPWEVEREIAALHTIELSLNDPHERAMWWEPLRQGRTPATPVPSSVTVDYNQMFPEYY
jgi:hypothetical protein